MTILNYDKANVSYQSKFRGLPPWNKSTNLIGAIAIVIATFAALFSNDKLLNKVFPFFCVGVLIQTSAKSKEIKDIKKIAESNRINSNRVELRLDSNDQEIKDLFFKLSKIKAQQEQPLKIDLDSLASKIAEMEVQLESNQVSNDLSLELSLSNEKIEHLDSIASKIIQIEAQFENYLPKSHLTPFRNKLSRLNKQYLEGKLLTPDALLKVDQLEKEVNELSNTVEVLFQNEQQRLVRFSVTKSYSVLPRKKPERPKGDRLGIFVDGTNISISAKKVWNCYPAWDRLLTLLKGKSVVCNARYYDSFRENKREFFIAVKNKGYQVITKPIIEHEDGTTKGNLDIEMANDIQACIEDYDTFVIVSCDGDFLDTVKKLRSIKKRVEVVSFFSRTHQPLARSADFYLDLEKLKDEISNQ